MKWPLTQLTKKLKRFCQILTLAIGVRFLKVSWWVCDICFKLQKVINVKTYGSVLSLRSKSYDNSQLKLKNIFMKWPFTRLTKKFKRFCQIMTLPTGVRFLRIRWQVCDIWFNCKKSWMWKNMGMHHLGENIFMIVVSWS
jgi:hypothetical protein